MKTIDPRLFVLGKAIESRSGDTQGMTVEELVKLKGDIEKYDSLYKELYGEAPKSDFMPSWIFEHTMKLVSNRLNRLNKS